MFARNGLPKTIKSDNGPQFASTYFEQYLKDIDVKHRKITPSGEWRSRKTESIFNEKNLNCTSRIFKLEDRSQEVFDCASNQTSFCDRNCAV